MRYVFDYVRAPLGASWTGSAYQMRTCCAAARERLARFAKPILAHVRSYLFWQAYSFACRMKPDARITVIT